MKKIFDVSAQTRSYTDTVIVRAEVVAADEEEAKTTMKNELFHSGKLYDFIAAKESPNTMTEGTPVFKRLDHYRLNY